MIFHKADGNYVVKSNAFGNLQQARSGSATYWTATMTGKATLAAPVGLLCGSQKCGNYSFTIYVEDRQEPGAGFDRLWIETRAPGGEIVSAASLPAPFPANAAVIAGGNIQVPQPQGSA